MISAKWGAVNKKFERSVGLAKLVADGSCRDRKCGCDVQRVFVAIEGDADNMVSRRKRCVREAIFLIA